jgi:hypothetical protein
MAMDAAAAELLAIRALGWLAGDDALWPDFLSATGAEAGDLRSAAADPAFLAAVLDFIMQADNRVIAFCDAENLPYDRPQQARQALPGGQQTNWT